MELTTMKRHPHYANGNIRAVAHVAATNSWPLHQVDIKTAFLRGVLEPGEEVYMKQPKCFKAKGEEDLIWELQKGLYGLPQAGRI